MIQVTLNSKTKTDKPLSSRLNFYSADYTQINNYLSSINWESILTTTDDINTMYKKFLDVIHKSISLFVPVKPRRRKSFIPKHIKKLLREKQDLYKKSKVDNSFITAYKEKAKLYKLYN